MNTVKLPNQQVIDAVMINDMDNRELAMLVRQVHRVVERNSKAKPSEGYVVVAILNNLTVAAESIEEFL